MVLRALGLFASIVLVVPSAIADACLSDPVKIPQNTVTSVFGKSRTLPQYGGATNTHWGVDFQARNPGNSSVGADLNAVDNGTVIGAGFWGSGYGNRVALKRDNGDIVIYSHLAKIEPRLKSGGSVGFKDAGGGVGNQRVSSGEKVGVAGGTADHKDTDQRAIHLHLEYVANYAGTKLRETNDGTNETRSKYMRNAVSYMCKAPAQAAGAGKESGSAGSGPVNPSGATADKNVPASSDQVAEATKTQPTVASNERYGIPDSPPYETYAGMSESQIIEAEMLRRTLDTEWEVGLTKLEKRGLWMEIARMRGVKLWLESKIADKNSRMESLLSTKLAFNVKTYFNPRMQAAYSRVQTISTMNKLGN